MNQYKPTLLIFRFQGKLEMISLNKTHQLLNQLLKDLQEQLHSFGNQFLKTVSKNSLEKKFVW